MSESSKLFPLGIQHIKSHSYFLCPPPTSLYHYTSSAGAAGIIRSHSLWLTKIQYLNDTGELKYAIDLARNRAASFIQRQAASPETEIVKTFIDQLSSFVETNICVASFCVDGNLLSQWRGYSAGGQGVALGFNGGRLSELAKQRGIRLLKCVYDHGQQAQIIDDFFTYLIEGFRNFKSKNIINAFTAVFLQIAPALKHPDFKEEHEWRMVTDSVPSTKSDYQIRESGGRLIPYFVLEFIARSDGRFEFLNDFFIGPNERAIQNGKALYDLASKCGVEFGQMSYSQTPYRQ